MTSVPDTRLALRAPTLVLAPMLAGAMLLAGCGRRPALTELGGETMGTTWQVVYAATEGEAGEEDRRIQGLLDEINQSLSTYLPDSIVSLVNDSTDLEVWSPVDAHFQKVFSRSMAVYEDTGGAFNPAVGPLVNAWGFGPEEPAELPDQDAIDALLPLVSFDAFEMRASPPGVRKAIPEARLDFSAIAKGYAVDATGELIESWGVEDYFVDIGGEVRTRGRHPEGRPWRIGIEKPAGSALARGQVQIVLELEDGALATSGDYRNYTVRDGQRMTHILNPMTGYPEDTPLMSVSVLAGDTMTADAYATAFMVMGVGETLRFVESRGGLEVYLIANGPAGEVLESQSSGFPEPVQ